MAAGIGWNERRGGDLCGIRVRGAIWKPGSSTMGISDILRVAGASSLFWIGLAVVLVIAVIGYWLSRRSAAGLMVGGEHGRVVHDWMPTGRIDFAGPSMDEGAAETPASFYLQAEDIRLLISLSGIERKEIRWRKATLNEAKRVVNVFHRQMGKETDRPAESMPPAAPAEDAPSIADASQPRFGKPSESAEARTRDVA
jgi:hypothetical protein